MLSVVHMSEIEERLPWWHPGPKENERMVHIPHAGYLAIVGLGPGQRNLMAPRAIEVIQEADLVIGYRLYLEQIQDLLSDKEIHASELTHERERAMLAVQSAHAGRRVCIVSSGDAGIYGMAGLVLDLFSQMSEETVSSSSDQATEPYVEVVPGISALN